MKLFAFMNTVFVGNSSQETWRDPDFHFHPIYLYLASRRMRIMPVRLWYGPGAFLRRHDDQLPSLSGVHGLKDFLCSAHLLESFDGRIYSYWSVLKCLVKNVSGPGVKSQSNVHSASPRSPAAGELCQQPLPRDVEEVLLLRNVDSELAGVLL